MTDGMIKIGGIASLIWFVGIIIAAVGLRFNATVWAAGGIIMGVGILLLGLTAIGFWQKDKTTLSIFTGIFGIVGGIVMLAGAAAIFAAVVIIYAVGAVLTGIFLILLGLMLVNIQSQLGTQARLGIDLAYPAVLMTFIGGAVHLTGTVAPAAPAALLLTIVLLLYK